MFLFKFHRRQDHKLLMRLSQKTRVCPPLRVKRSFGGQRSIFTPLSPGFSLMTGTVGGGRENNQFSLISSELSFYDPHGRDQSIQLRLILSHGMIRDLCLSKRRTLSVSISNLVQFPHLRVKGDSDQRMFWAVLMLCSLHKYCQNSWCCQQITREAAFGTQRCRLSLYTAGVWDSKNLKPPCQRG